MWNERLCEVRVIANVSVLQQVSSGPLVVGVFEQTLRINVIMGEDSWSINLEVE